MILTEELDSIFDSVVPQQINLKSFTTKETLNPKIWNNGRLNPTFRKQLLKIAKEFIESVKFTLPVVDIIMVGSSTSYNWSKYSDIDLHILVDFTQVDCITDEEVLKDYFTCKKNDWNNKHTELRIASYPVELYIQSDSEENASDGVYSIRNDYWIKQPVTKNLELDRELIKEQAATLINRIEEFESAFETCQSRRKLHILQMLSEQLYDTIVQGRKDGLNKNGESSPENIVFKVLRRSGHLARLKDLKLKIFDKVESA